MPDDRAFDDEVDRRHAVDADGEQVFQAVHLMEIGQSDESECREHEDALARAEVAAVDTDEKLEDEHEDDPAGARVAMRLREHGELAGEELLRGEQQRRAEDEQGDDAGEGLFGGVQQDHRTRRAAEERRDHQPEEPALELCDVVAKSDHAGE